MSKKKVKHKSSNKKVNKNGSNNNSKEKIISKNDNEIVVKIDTNNANPKEIVWKRVIDTLGLFGIFISVASLIYSGISFSFAKNLSPLTYSSYVDTELVCNISIDGDTVYNISDFAITIKNNPGSISEIFIANVENNLVDIHTCTYNNLVMSTLNDVLAIKYECSQKSLETRLSIGFSSIINYRSGYFFVILKAYSGEYYYNIVHYILDDNDNGTGLYFINAHTQFFNIQKIYDRVFMNNLCKELASKEYNKDQDIDVNNYVAQIENDYKLLKEKIEL